MERVCYWSVALVVLVAVRVGTMYDDSAELSQHDAERKSEAVSEDNVDQSLLLALPGSRGIMSGCHQASVGVQMGGKRVLECMICHGDDSELERLVCGACAARLFDSYGMKNCPVCRLEDSRNLPHHDDSGVRNQHDHACAMKRSLCEHIEKGDLVMTKGLLQYCHVNDVLDGLGRTSLHYAAMSGVSDIVCLLLERGALGNMQDWTGYTALHYACAKGYVRVVHTLLDWGAHAWLASSLGVTPLHEAARVGLPPCSVARLFALEPDSPVDSASARLQDMHGNTPLHYAVFFGTCKDLIDVFIRCGGKEQLGITNADGVTPLGVALRSNHILETEALLRHGAPYDDNDRMHIAALLGDDHFIVQQMRMRLKGKRVRFNIPGRIK